MTENLNNSWGLAEQTPQRLEKEIVTLKEAAKYLGISKSQLYKLNMARKIPYSCPGGKIIYYRREDLDAYMLGKPRESQSQLEDEMAEHFGRMGQSRQRSRVGRAKKQF